MTSAVVAAGGDQVADVGADAVGGVGSACAAEFAALPAEALNAVVDEVDVGVAGGRDRERLTLAVEADPEVGHRVDVLVERAGADAIVGCVGVERSGVAVSQLQ